ncbi:MAG TPA: cyclase family protein [Longimicrobium sp.]|jgi:kynurenine formamidase
MCCPELVKSALADHPVPAGSGEIAPAVRFADGGGAPFRRLADLTHVITPNFPIFPFYKPFAMRPLAVVDREGFCANELCYAEHLGTHIDAPAHFVSGGATVEHLPASSLLAPLVVVSLVDRAKRDEDTLLVVDDLLAWERHHGRIPAGAVVALYSGWEERVGDPARFLNADASGTMHSPGFSGEAVQWMVDERNINGAAIDTVSLDAGNSVSYDAHRLLLGAGKYGLENVANLGTVPPAGATLVIGAPKHERGTGGPSRVLALY